MKKVKIKKLLILLTLVGIAGIGTTAAYFTAYDRTINQVAVGRNVTEITEDFPGPTPIPEGENLKFKKVVCVTNDSDEMISNVDCYVRVMVSFSNYDIGKAVTLTGMDTQNWIYDADDGYYYYKNILEKGKSTTPLFTGFLIEQEKVDKQYMEQIGDFHINVYEESVQKGDFSDYRSAWDYYLNPVGRLYSGEG